MDYKDKADELISDIGKNIEEKGKSPDEKQIKVQKEK